MSVRILVGDVRERLADLPDESVHCVVTSPPYFGLRDYGTASWEGGDPVCDHSPEKCGGRFASPVSGKQASNAGSGTASQRDCPCGATRTDKQIGLEDTPAAFVETMVAVFREVRRVLRSDGTLWLNLGDSYASSPASGGTQSAAMTGGEHKRTPSANGYKRPEGLKPKDLIGIPWRVAFALQADGWYLRQDIIWSKPNPMPESVTDRCTKAHEYLFLLSKSARYHYDAEAVAEPAQDWSTGGPGVGIAETHHYGARNGGNGGLSKIAGRYKAGDAPTTRNRRSVWTVATQPFSEAHFATFPPALIEPCIMAGCPKGGTVLDPFGGAGTTGLVADRLGRAALLIELNPAYAELARSRIHGDSTLFSDVTVAA